MLQSHQNWNAGANSATHPSEARIWGHRRNYTLIRSSKIQNAHKGNYLNWSISSLDGSVPSPVETLEAWHLGRKTKIKAASWSKRWLSQGHRYERQCPGPASQSPQPAPLRYKHCIRWSSSAGSCRWNPNSAPAIHMGDKAVKSSGHYSSLTSPI